MNKNGWEQASKPQSGKPTYMYNFSSSGMKKGTTSGRDDNGIHNFYICLVDHRSQVSKDSFK